MKIRTQFHILIVGIVVVPVLALVGLYAIQKALDGDRFPVPDYEEVSRLAGDSLQRAEWERLSDFIARRKVDMNFIVLRDNHQIIFSTTDTEKAGGFLDAGRLMDMIRRTSDRYLYIFDSPVRLANRDALVIMRLDRDLPSPPKPLIRFLGYLAFVLAVLFMFSAAMSVFIARSITRSVTILEESTRRIAAGELDLSIDAKGSNEITSLTASLNLMRLSLKEQEIRRARFIMGVSHDLKTPLALIKGYAEAIADGMAEDAESRERSVEIIGSKVDQLDGMIDDLIDFVKVDTGEWRRKLARIELASFLAAYAKRVTADAELLNRRAECSIDIPGGLTVPMDDRLALRALENLVNNALRYTAPGGLVRLAARMEGSRAVVVISDDGPGIGAEELTRIFDPFYRGSASRREQGMGLGLSVVKGVVDSHGWEISVSSEKGKGSSFRIEIPTA